MRLSVFNCFIFSLMLAGSVQEVCGQVSIRQFLQSADRDPAVQSLNDQITYLNKKTYRLSMLNKFELRAQNNELGNKTSQRYGVRVSPSNPWEVRNTNRYFNTYGQSLSLEKEIIYKQALAERYELVVEYLYYENVKELLEKDKKLLDAQYNVIAKQQASDYFDADDLADLRLEQIDRLIETEELLSDMRKQRAEIDHHYNGEYVNDVFWKQETIISINTIQNVMDSLAASVAASSALAHQQMKINLARRAYSLERSNINLGFIQTTYTEGRTIQDRTPWGLSVGLNIPITNPNKGDMAKRQLDVIEEEYKKSGIEFDETKAKAVATDQLKESISSYKATQARISELNIDAIANTLSVMKNNNPLIQLKLNSSVVKLELVLAKLRRDIMLNYIDFLSAHDKLQQQPLVNYLSSSFETIGE